MAKPKADAGFAGAQGYADLLHDNPDFEAWWSMNHPFDWWAKVIGEPLPFAYRLRVWELCKKAYEDQHDDKAQERREGKL